MFIVFMVYIIFHFVSVDVRHFHGLLSMNLFFLFVAFVAGRNYSDCLLLIAFSLILVTLT